MPLAAALRSQKGVFGDGECDGELGAVFGVFGFDGAAHFGDDAVADGQAEARALSDLLGSDKGLENSPHDWSAPLDPDR